MSYPTLFTIANFSVIPAWFLLVVFPRKRITQLVVQSYLYPILLALLYLFLLIVSWGGEGGMDTLENLKLSFSRDDIMVLGWVHYLAFDLFIGAWMVRDSQQHDISHLSIVPSLILTLLAGPIGLLTYLIIRYSKHRKLTF